MSIDSHLMDRLFGSPQLPSMPAVAMQIIDLVQQDEVNVDKIVDAVSLDPALSTKMLKTVNSSFYGLPKTIGSVHQAVVVLGLNSVKTL
ncbi:MAG: HDOD domain-containing protein, partial [Planctomycetota bacterium]